MEVEWIPSPNKTVGRRGYRPEAIVIHIMEGSLAGTDSWFRSRASNVSAHYGIGKGGEIHQYVREVDAAWHAGRKTSDATWQLLKPNMNPNYYTVGIEHEGFGDDRWPAAMYEASAALIKEISHRWDIPIDRKHIIGHREINTNKTCPGSQVSIRKLLRMVKGRVADPNTYNLVEDRGTVRARDRLNVRRQLPTTAAGVVRTVNAGTQLRYVGWTSNGQAIDCNSHWYSDRNGNYFWAGGTYAPIPGLD